MLYIRAHFDGRVLVPDQPVDLPVNQPLDIQVVPCPTTGNSNGAPATDPSVIRERLRQLDALKGLISGPLIPLEALRRENLYDERV